ncbi:uncharacterized protein VTP21DRAFT_7156 [Calcarisporiella thermophila]|uniref:uncharacterized protein n=1 Tax=Calcarisporiella thermophila TaxID=911321 RepID=UPI003744A4A6
MDRNASSSSSSSSARKRNLSISKNIFSEKPSETNSLKPNRGSSTPDRPKKLVIKGFKVKPKLPDNYEAETWAKLQCAVRAVLNNRAVSDSQEELYKDCENLCHHKLSDVLYERLKKECENHVLKRLSKLRDTQGDNEVFLKTVKNYWLDHCRQMVLIRSIFLYLDRTYVLQTSGLSSLWDMGLTLFRKLIMEEQDVQTKTLRGILELIHKERSGESVDRYLLSSLLHMFLDLGIYHEVFEEAFLQETQQYYHTQGEELVNMYEVPQYLRYVKARLIEEGEERINHYLDKSTKQPLISAVESELLERHIQTLLQNGFSSMMDRNHKEDLKLMYNLFARVRGLEHLRGFFGAYVNQYGTSIVKDPTHDPNMVQELLEFKSKVDCILNESFARNEQFANSLKDNFERFINSRQNKPAELIAKYVDTMLRSGNKTASDEEIESILDKVLILFRYIQGKDVFEAFYKKDLAKRLLLGKSASVDAEKSMLSKLKAECGAGFTSKLEGMFKDIDISKDIMASFRSSKYHDQIHGLELTVNILTQGFWPTYPPTELTLPPFMAETQDVFKNFYLGKHSGRRLFWQNSLGHCVLKAIFPKGNKEVQVSLFQTVVLLLFNDCSRQSIPYSEIKEMTNIEEKELRRTLQSLACGKVRVLNKHPKGKDVMDDDSFSFNSDFTSPQFRIKINAIQLKETVEENASTHERVFQDRQYQVDAAIVRIMKARKTLTHTMLIKELFEQLRFPATAADLKKRIESLIDREYLERDQDEASTYHYLA